MSLLLNPSEHEPLLQAPSPPASPISSEKLSAVRLKTGSRPSSKSDLGSELRHRRLYRLQNVVRVLLQMTLMYFVAVSLALIVCTVVLEISFWDYRLHTSIFLTSALAIGLFIGLIAVFGFVGTCMASRPLIAGLSLANIVLGGLTAAGCVITAMWLARSQMKLDQIWDRASTHLLSYIQQKWDCCGFLSTSDRPIRPCPVGSSQRPCAPILQVDYRIFLKIVFACCFGISFTAVSAAVLSFITIHLMNRLDNLS